MDIYKAEHTCMSPVGFSRVLSVGLCGKGEAAGEAAGDDGGLITGGGRWRENGLLVVKKEK